MLIGLTGKKFHGKDTVAKILSDILNEKIIVDENNKDYTLLSFADPIKQALSIIHVIPKNYFDDPELKEKPLPQWNGMTPRSLAQWLGTDIYRDMFDTDIWLQNMRLRIGLLKNVIVTDVRFDNEAKLIKNMGGVILKVDASNRKISCDVHISEQGINPSLVDVVVYNNGNIDDLLKLLKKISFDLLWSEYGINR